MIVNGHDITYRGFSGFKCIYCNARNYEIDRVACESVIIIQKELK